MQITLNQDEIETAIRTHVLNQIVIRDDQEVSVDLRAGRGENGFTATLDIQTRKEVKANPLIITPENVGNLIRGNKPAMVITNEVKITRSICESPSKEAETESSEEPLSGYVATAPVPAATGVTLKAAAKKAQAEAPKKGIFTMKPAAPAAVDPFSDGEEAPPEETIPEQETPAEEEARAEATPEEEPKKASIFAFGKTQKSS